MITLITNPSQIITVNTNGTNLKRGKSLKDINPVYDHHLVVENGKIKDIIPFSSLGKIKFDDMIDINGKTILPGLVECHTHLVFAGSRADEFNEKIKGITYEDIAVKGGGINKTVEAVRKKSFEELVELSKPKVEHFIKQGVTTLEIKSGYGLDFDNEIKILQVINKLNSIYPIDIIPTFLGAHTFPSEYKNNKEGYIDLIINKMLPYISQNKLAKFCDGFCESTAFSTSQIDEIFNAAKFSGLKIKFHTNQFNSIGGIDIALKYNSVSADHLEVINKTDIKKLAGSSTVCILLPGVPFFLNYDYAPALELIDDNAIVALATDYNPGSSNINSIGLIMSLAALKMGMNCEEIISAYTINAAASLDMNDNVGSIEIGKQADFSVIDTSDYNDLIYRIGDNINYMTIKNGEVIYKAGT